MKVEFPLKHIENNLIFNRNGDVWAYFKTDILNLFLLNYQDKNIHIYTNNQLGENIFYVGFKLENVLTDKSRFKVNIKSFFEGFTAQVNRSVGLDSYSIIKDDVVDYSKQSKRIELFLQKRMSVVPLLTSEILMFYNNLLGLDTEINDGFMELSNVSFQPHDSNVLLIDNKTTNKALYIQYLSVKKMGNIESVVSLLDLQFSLGISIRTDFKSGTSISVRVESSEIHNIIKQIDGLYSYANLIDISLFSPLGEQFKFLYESALGSNKLDSNYDIKHYLEINRERKVK